MLEEGYAAGRRVDAIPTGTAGQGDDICRALARHVPELGPIAQLLSHLDRKVELGGRSHVTGQVLRHEGIFPPSDIPELAQLPAYYDGPADLVPAEGTDGGAAGARVSFTMVGRPRS